MYILYMANIATYRVIHMADSFLGVLRRPMCIHREFKVGNAYHWAEHPEWLDITSTAKGVDENRHVWLCPEMLVPTNHPI